ncbi:MAG: hypothetical protein CVU57_10795 [Deltaproteobacteria bacterium HGW-Deltaproteobacteria-15]|jgi:PAS domain S-box-containing protein|nr:MAG: hypothetical protein CVU57_10795 [Deltaproteobacteria bacterium HGW-Deltaproteobacteria-15]
MADDSLNLCVTDDIASEIIRSMSDGLLVLDRRGMIVSVNPAALEMLDLHWKDVRERPFGDLFPFESANEEFRKTVMDCMQSHTPMRNKEVSFRTLDGGVKDLSVNASLLKRDEQSGAEEAVVVVLRDMTEMKSLDRARKRVLDHLSHELKTPLAVIKGSLNHIKTSESPAIERIHRNLKRLEEIQSEVDDIIRHREIDESYPFGRWLAQILDLADLLSEGVPACGDSLRDLRAAIEGLFIQGETVRDTRAGLGRVSRETLRKAKEQASHRDIHYVVHLDEDPEIAVPPEMLEKALMAPLKNAIENTPDGGTISISLETFGRKAVLSITDTGVGITEESRKQIFSGFYHARQTDFYSTKRPFDFGAGGKGLDLLRVRILSEAYGFGVECVSTRCRHLPEESQLCPGNTANCRHIRSPQECGKSGSTLFKLTFDVVS